MLRKSPAGDAHALLREPGAHRVEVGEAGDERVGHVEAGLHLVDARVGVEGRRLGRRAPGGRPPRSAGPAAPGPGRGGRRGSSCRCGAGRRSRSAGRPSPSATSGCSLRQAMRARRLAGRRRPRRPRSPRRARGAGPPGRTRRAGGRGPPARWRRRGRRRPAARDRPRRAAGRGRTARRARAHRASTRHDRGASRRAALGLSSQRRMHEAAVAAAGVEPVRAGARGSVAASDRPTRHRRAVAAVGPRHRGGVRDRAAPAARVDALVPDVLERDAPVAGVGGRRCRAPAPRRAPRRNVPIM